MRSSFERVKGIKIATQCCRQRSRSLFPDILKRFNANIRKISKKDLVALHCRTLWSANTRTRVENGHGNGFFPLLNITLIELPGKNAATIYTNQFCNEPSVTRS